MNYKQKLLKSDSSPSHWPNHELTDGHAIGQNTTAYEEEAELREGVLHGLSLAYGVPQGHPYLLSLLMDGEHHHHQVHHPGNKILHTSIECHIFLQQVCQKQKKVRINIKLLMRK